MAFVETIYERSPIWFQNLMISCKGYINNFSRYGKAYDKAREFYNDFDAWPFEKKEQYQNSELVKFVKFAYDNSPFYKNLYKDIDIERITCVGNLKSLPIVEKEELRKNIDSVVTIKHRGAVEGHTGGTTGKSLVVLSTKSDMMKRMAMLDNFKARVGFENRQMIRATFNGKHIIPPKQKKKVFWRYNVACKQMIFSSFHLTEENIPYYIEELNLLKPQSLDGFFTSMCDIASFIERHNIVVKFTPIAIFPTSETLTDIGRLLLERVFKCKVFDQYASSEGAPFITECSNQVKHMEMASGVFEHIQENNDEILVTSFTTHGTPLIRYRIGDRIRWKSTLYKCSCGVESIKVDSIEGRKLDFLYTAEGAKINGGNIANLFKNMPNAIIRAQLIQETMEEVIVLLEVDRNLYKSEYDLLLKKEFEHKFGKNTKIKIEHVDNIPRSKSGKYQMIINRLLVSN